MMTSILLIDVQGLEARVGGGLSPADLLAELSHTMHGMTRQIMVQRAYCSSRISAYRRNAYRDAGYQIVETAGPDETLIMMTLDLADLSGGNAVYEEAILLGGTADYTALARLAHENLMMISVMDHPTITASLESVADGLIDPDDLPLSDTPSILDRSDGKREETPRKSPFLAPPPASSILNPATSSETTPEPEAAPEAKADEAEPEEKIEAKQEAEATSAPKADTDDDGKDSGKQSSEQDSDDAETGDSWPDPKTGPILIAGGSIADAVGLATALDDPKDASAKEETTTVENAEPTHPVEADLAEEINAELSVSAEDIGKNPNEPADAVLIDLQIEDLVAEEFTETPETQLATPPIPPLPEAIQSAVANETPAETAVEGDDTLDELFADLGADLTPEAPSKTEAASADPLDSLNIAPEELLADLDPLEPVSLEPTSASPDEPQVAADETKEEGDKASTKELSEEVDELLSRLMSDGPSGAPTEDVKLDVVPER